MCWVADDRYKIGLCLNYLKKNMRVVLRGGPAMSDSYWTSLNPWVYFSWPQPLRISRSLAFAEFSVKGFSLFMWRRVFEACSQICYLTGYWTSVWYQQLKGLESIWVSLCAKMITEPSLREFYLSLCEQSMQLTKGYCYYTIIISKFIWEWESYDL